MYTEHQEQDNTDLDFYRLGQKGDEAPI
jgi:hypothetical protein